MRRRAIQALKKNKVLLPDNEAEDYHGVQIINGCFMLFSAASQMLVKKEKNNFRLSLDHMQFIVDSCLEGRTQLDITSNFK